MKKILFLAMPLGLACIFSCSKNEKVQPVGTDTVVTHPVVTPPKTNVYTFDTTAVWSDDFDTDGAPDPDKWTYDVGSQNGGWGNNELEYYTNTTNNASINNGILTITAKKESMGGMNYTSSRMVSKATSDMLYGRIEIRAKLPQGRGTWPAIWMLPNDWAYGDWPKSGEIDIMEHVGYDPNVVHFSVHDETRNGANSNTATLTIPTAMTDFHIYRCDWTPDGIKGYYDGSLMFTYLNDKKGSYTTWPFDKPFHLLLNLAIGGNWGGINGVDDTAFPTSMQVDYVHFYKMITTVQ